MPEENQTNTSLLNDTQAPKVPTATDNADAKNPASEADIAAPVEKDLMSEVAAKISEAHNVLVALSSDPTVDEISAAIGLSMYLDKMGKRATAIYSGSTPNALEFLKPEETFDKTADTLQDFVIALNKEKADHLRYKLDGDYVKIFITPYRSRIGEEDLAFSYGDFNIDLVLALDVANGVDLDSALREHGRIMHDAAVINITTGNPGKFGEIEWSDKKASSVCEMIAHLLYEVGGKSKIQPEEATAFLTGIIAATDRFSKGNTTSETMKIASNLMESGADQQLIAKNITADINNQFFAFSDSSEETNEDPTALNINHAEEGEISEEPDATLEPAAPSEPEIEEKPEEDPLLEELKATEASLANAGAETTPEVKEEPLRLDTLPALSATPETTSPELPQVSSGTDNLLRPEKVITPPEDFAAETLSEGTNKYGEMLEAALAEANPATAAVPEVATSPEVNGVPDINYLPMPDDQVLPPPPTPAIDFSTIVPPTELASPAPAVTPEPAITAPEQPTAASSEPVLTAAPTEAPAPQPVSPDAFKIPGM
ncbi:MAG: hypothetical protein Q4B29_00515 [Candidatus Saccharibacteria bacterium]|nr:hypothetical protein [Candidatus Saccharibacteria bacterium]